MAEGIELRLVSVLAKDQHDLWALGVSSILNVARLVSIRDGGGQNRNFVLRFKLSSPS
jgi:hypothetical protein